MPDPTILISPLVDRDPDAVRRMVARAIGIGLWVWPAFTLLDAWMCFVAYPGAPFGLFLAYRVAVELAFLGVWVASRRPGVDVRRLFYSLNLCYGLAALVISLMAVHLGGIRSPYMHGISIVALIRAALVPSSWQRSLPTFARIGVAFPLVLGAGAGLVVHDRVTQASKRLVSLEAALERSPRIYGGTTAAEAAAARAFVERGGTAIAEFNSLGSPTEAEARAALEDLFGVRWTHWIGRYFPHLENPDEVPGLPGEKWRHPTDEELFFFQDLGGEKDAAKKPQSGRNAAQPAPATGGSATAPAAAASTAGAGNDEPRQFRGQHGFVRGSTTQPVVMTDR